jgi:hypothetical protein
MTTGSNTTPPPAYGNERTFSSATLSDGTVVNVGAKAFSATGDNSSNRNTRAIESAYLSVYTPINGLGVVNRDGSSNGSVAVNSSTGADDKEFVNNGSEHSMDNHDRSDAIMLTFTEQVALQSLRLGWLNNDSDLFILAWSGAGAPSLVGSSFAAIATDTLNDPNNGWKLIDSLSNVLLNTNTSFNTSTPAYSSYWLIGTGGFDSTIGVTSGDKNASGTWRSFGSMGAKYDYVKLAGLGGLKNDGGTSTDTGSVPEPGSLALAGAAFLGMIGIRRRKSI